MKVGDLVKVWWYHKEAIGIVLEVRRKTCTVMSDKYGIHEYDKGHVGRIDESR